MTMNSPALSMAMNCPMFTAALGNVVRYSRRQPRKHRRAVREVALCQARELPKEKPLAMHVAGDRLRTHVVIAGRAPPGVEADRHAGWAFAGEWVVARHRVRVRGVGEDGAPTRQPATSSCAAAAAAERGVGQSVPCVACEAVPLAEEQTVRMVSQPASPATARVQASGSSRPSAGPAARGVSRSLTPSPSGL
jgi:hypothetical protein